MRTPCVRLDGKAGNYISIIGIVSIRPEAIPVMQIICDANNRTIS